MTERNNGESSNVSDGTGVRLLATANVEHNDNVGVLVNSTMESIEVDLYKSAKDGSIVVSILTNEVTQETPLRVHLNDETLYDSTTATEATKTEGE